MYVRLPVCVSVCMCMSACAYVCSCICVCVYMPKSVCVFNYAVESRTVDLGEVIKRLLRVVQGTVPVLPYPWDWQ